MRKIGLLAAVGIGVLALGASVVPAGAGDSQTTIVVKKVVSGPTAAATTVVVDCEAYPDTTLTFDATGAPNTTTNNSWVKSNGGWALFANFLQNRSECSFTETVTGGAASTSWTCVYQSTEFTGPSSKQVQSPGCAATSGTGTGAVTVLYASTGDELLNQM